MGKGPKGKLHKFTTHRSWSVLRLSVFEHSKPLPLVMIESWVRAAERERVRIVFSLGGRGLGGPALEYYYF